ncbi:MAG: hypothetical protein Q9165_000001 [Trypethelium subeluteriae]
MANWSWLAVPDFSEEAVRGLTRLQSIVKSQLYIASPTPFVVVSSAAFVTGFPSGTDCISLSTYTSSFTTEVLDYLVDDPNAGALDDNFFVDPNHPEIVLDPPWYWLPGSEKASSMEGQFPQIPVFPGLLSFIVSQSTVISKYPFLTQCGGGGGAGAPTVHIPVAELTIEAATTIRVGGNPGSESQGGGRGDTTVKASGGMSITGGDPPQPTQTAQPHSTTHAGITPTATILPNPSSTLPMGTSSINPAPPPDRQSSTNEPPQNQPQSIASLGEGDANAGQPEPQRPGLVPDSGSGSGTVRATPQVAGAGPHGSQEPAMTPGTVASGNAPSTHNYGDSTDGNSSNGGISQVDKEAGVDIMSALKTPEGESQASIDRAGNGEDFVNSQENQYSVPGNRNSGQAPETTAPCIVIGGAIATPVASDTYILPGGHTISVGGAPVVTAGETLSLDTSGAVVINGQTLGSAIATPVGSDAVAIEGQTLSLDGVPVVISGTTYSLGLSSAVVINGHTISSLSINSGYDYFTSSGITAITFGSAIFTAASALGSALVIDEQTLLPGNAITVTQKGHIETISVPSDSLVSGGYLGVVNGVTQSLVSGQWLLTEPNGVILTLSPTEVGNLVVDGTTLTPGDALVVSDGVTISEAPNGDVIEASGSVTSTIGSVKESEGMGYYVHSGIGGSTTSAPITFLGEGGRRTDRMWLSLETIAAVGFGIGVLLL